MAWFFTNSEIENSIYTIEGGDASHISKSLRMKQGEEITLVTPQGIQHNCLIDNVLANEVTVKVKESFDCQNEPNVKVTLYQALTKGDKMDYIIQKSVELGVGEIVPVISARCISRPDEKSMNKKIQRWQKIAKEAAQQSRRGIIPTVKNALTFKQAVQDCSQKDANIIFYEGGGEKVGDILTHNPETLGIFIGSEGGFELGEVTAVTDAGGKTATLGKRILRAETAPLAALSVIMYATGNFE